LLKMAKVVLFFCLLAAVVSCESVLYQRRVLNSQFYDGKRVVATELNGAAQFPPSFSEAQGIAVCAFNPYEDYDMQCSIIHNSGDIKSISIGLGAPGAPGVTFYQTSTRETFLEFEFQITDSKALGLVASEIVELILSGEAYITISSDSFPNGEIRGQLSAHYTFVAILDSDQLVPFNDAFEKFDSEHKGMGLFSLKGDQLTSTIMHTVDDQDVYVSGFYKAAFGRNGNLVAKFGKTKSIISETTTLNDTMINAIYHSNVYVKILSKTHSFGEIRGQIVPLSPIPRITHTSVLRPADGTLENIFGCALFAFNCDTNLLEFFFQQNVRNSTLRLLNSGDQKVFSVPFDGPQISYVGSFRVFESEQIDLVFDTLSIVVVTDEHPDGILFGSVTRDNSHAAYLQGTQVVGGSTTPYAGCGILNFDDDTNVLNYHFQHDIPRSQKGEKLDIDFGAIGYEEGPAFSITRPGQPFKSGVQRLSYDEESALKIEELHANVRDIKQHNILRGQIKPLGSPRCLP